MHQAVQDGGRHGVVAEVLAQSALKSLFAPVALTAAYPYKTF